VFSSTYAEVTTMKGAVPLLLLVSMFLTHPTRTRAEPPDDRGAAGTEGDLGEDTAPDGMKFEMVDVKWDKVFAWLTEQTEVPVVCSFTPTGSFTFVGPEGARYTMSEIQAHIDVGLRKQGFTLIRRKRSFAFVPVDALLEVDKGGTPLYR
jgi:hypothetical protein